MSYLSIVKRLQLFPIVATSVHVPIFLRNCNWVFKARLKPNTIFPLNFTPIKQYPNEILSHKRISSYSIMAILWEGHTFRIWVFNMFKTIQFYWYSMRLIIWSDTSPKRHISPNFQQRQVSLMGDSTHWRPNGVLDNYKHVLWNFDLCSLIFHVINT